MNEDCAAVPGIKRLDADLGLTQVAEGMTLTIEMSNICLKALKAYPAVSQPMGDQKTSSKRSCRVVQEVVRQLQQFFVFFLYVSLVLRGKKCWTPAFCSSAWILDSTLRGMTVVFLCSAVCVCLHMIMSRWMNDTEQLESSTASFVLWGHRGKKFLKAAVTVSQVAADTWLCLFSQTALEGPSKALMHNQLQIVYLSRSYHQGNIYTCYLVL